MTAYSYAIEVAKRYCRPINSKRWIDLSIALMQADFIARQKPENFENNKPSLRWNVIRDYHVAAFRNVCSLPPVAWTAWIPLYVQGETKDEKLWHRLLTEDFMNVAVDTVSLVLGRWSQKAGVSQELAQSVNPILKTAPPVVTGSQPQDPAYDRCMKQLSTEQMQGDNTRGERMALFYFDCLGSAANVVGRPSMPYAGVYGPDGHDLTVGDVRRAIDRRF